MSLYISNFNLNTKIKFGILFFVILVASYLLLSNLSFKKIKRIQAQNQWQDNIIRIENALIKKNQIEKIIIGSSISARIDSLALTSSTYNLSFAGSSSLTGIAILKSLEIYPPNIFIELNVLKPIDQELIKKIKFNKHFFPYIMESNQPVTLLASYINRNKSEVSSEYSPELYATGLRQQLEENSKNPCPQLENLNQKIDSLKEMIQVFKAKNSRINFLVLPIDPKLKKLKCLNEYYSNLKNKLSEDTWLSTEEFFQTSDGLHLIPSEASKFIQTINKENHLNL